ncbi:MAG: DUF4870 domain-containing protein [Aggregatilineales bacterium]
MTDSANDAERRRRLRVPSLDELLNGDGETSDALPDENEADAEARPTSDDFGAFAGGASRPRESAGFSSHDVYEKPKRKAKPSYQPLMGLTVEERRWAALAHASVLLTLLAAVGSAGILALVTLFVPLGIYFHWRTRSDYVAFQALQAFTLQALGTVGWLLLLLGGTIVGVLLIVTLAITLIGIPLLIVVIPALILFILATLVMPFGMLVYSLIAAFQTWNGVDYRLPRIARWIDRQMRGGFLADL